MKLLILTITFLATSLVSLLAQDASKRAEQEVLDAFVNSLESQETDARQRAAKALDSAKAQTASATIQLAEGVKALYPSLGAAMAKTSEGDGHEGLRELYKLAHSKDKFLAAEANYVMARTLSSQQRYEEALPFLEPLRQHLQAHTMRHGDVLYYLGMAQANSLEKEAAIQTLSMFLEDYPAASERLKISAQATLDGILGVDDGSIDDIADHMDFSHRRLSVDDPGEKTQEVQGKIVAMLDDIIKAAEEQQQQQQQQQQQGSGAGAQGQQQKGQQPGKGEGQNPGGNGQAQNGPKKVRRIDGAAKSAWDDLRKRQRENDALSGLKSKYPPRYQELVEQYFSDLQQGGDEGADEAFSETPQP